MVEIKTGANTGFASCGVKCLTSSAVFQINFSAGLTVLCSEIPHEREAPKRYESGNENGNKARKLIKIG